MTDTIILFEDEGYRGLLPLVYTRPLHTLRCGAVTLHERVTLLTGQQPGALFRPHLAGFDGVPGWFGSLFSESRPVTLINSRSLDLAWLPQLLNEPLGTTYVTDPGPTVLQGPLLLGARVTPALASVLLSTLLAQQGQAAMRELQRFTRLVEVRTRVLNWPWDLIVWNGAQIEADLPLLLARGLRRPLDLDGHVVLRGEHVYVDERAQIDGPVVLDSRDGPVLIEGARIEPFSFIQGPCYIGPGTLVASACVRGETSLGPVCRVGGEVEASIMQGYSNKHHDGFLGHSYVGEWVNIGAMTTNSDLKNTYGTIRMVLEGFGQLDSGVIKLGCFLADHVKLGIGLHLTGGAIIGAGSNIFGIHFAPKTVPPFTWGGDVFREYRIDSMIDVARRVMARRKVQLTPHYEQLLREVHTMTRQSRLPLTGVTRLSATPAAPAEQAALSHAEALAVDG